MEIIIGKNAGFCYGVQRAVDKALEEVKKNKTYCLGEMVHNQEEMSRLEKLGRGTVSPMGGAGLTHNMRGQPRKFLRCNGLVLPNAGRAQNRRFQGWVRPSFSGLLGGGNEKQRLYYGARSAGRFYLESTYARNGRSSRR